MNFTENRAAHSILTDGFPVGGPNESLNLSQRVPRASETEPEYAAPVWISLHRVLVLPEEVGPRTVGKPDAKN